MIIYNKVGKKGDVHITEYMSAQKKKVSKEQFELLFSKLRDSIVLISEDYKILYVNEMATQQLGKNLIGNICYHALFNHNQPCEPCAVKEIILKKQKQYRFEKEISLKKKLISISR